MTETPKPRTYIISKLEGYDNEIPMFTFDNPAPERNVLISEIQTGDAELSLETDGITNDEAPVEDSESQ